jgi:hypothetical protein
MLVTPVIHIEFLKGAATPEKRKVINKETMSFYFCSKIDASPKIEGNSTSANLLG